MGFVRLACLIHAANVRSEPESNPSKNLLLFPRTPVDSSAQRAIIHIVLIEDVVNTGAISFSLLFDNVEDSKPSARMCFAEQADTSLQTGEDDGVDALSQ